MSNLSEWRVRIFTEGEVYKLGMPKRAELSMLRPPRMVYEKLVDGVWTEAQPTDEEIGQTDCRIQAGCSARHSAQRASHTASNVWERGQNERMD